MPAVHIFRIEAVHGLAIFQHHIVCNIHKVVDGAHAAQAQALAHPAGRGLHAHVFHHGAHIAVAKLRVFNFHAQLFGRVAVAGLHLGHMVAEGHAKRGSRLAPKAAHRKAVWPVGGYFKLYAHVVQPQHGRNGRAQRRGLVQHHNAVLALAGKIVQGKAQLANGAHHAIRFHPAQLAAVNFLAAGQAAAVARHRHIIAGLQVCSACHNLNGLFFAHVYLAHKKAVGVRVLFYLFYAAHHYVFNGVCLAAVCLHLRAGHCHALGKFMGRAGEGGEFFRPFQWHFHRFIPP